MSIRKVNIADIIPYERNPRRNNKAVDAVAASIKEFGYRGGIKVDKDMVLGFYWCEVRVATGPGLEDYGAYVKEYVWENGYEEMLDCEIEMVGKTIRQILQEQTPEQIIFI